MPHKGTGERAEFTCKQGSFAAGKLTRGRFSSPEAQAAASPSDFSFSSIPQHFSFGPNSRALLSAVGNRSPRRLQTGQHNKPRCSEVTRQMTVPSVPGRWDQTRFPSYRPCPQTLTLLHYVSSEQFKGRRSYGSSTLPRAPLCTHGHVESIASSLKSMLSVNI